MATKRRRAYLILSATNLLELHPDAIHNSFLKTGIRLPVSEFSFKFGENTPKKYKNLVGPEFLNMEEAVDAIGKFIRDQKLQVINERIGKLEVEKREEKMAAESADRHKLTTGELLKQAVDEYEQQKSEEPELKSSNKIKKEKERGCISIARVLT